MTKRRIFAQSVFLLPFIPKANGKISPTQDEQVRSYEACEAIISSFILGWKNLSLSYVKKPLEEVLWCPVNETFRNDLLNAAARGNLELVSLMLLFAKDELSKQLAILLIIARPVDYSVVLKWEIELNALGLRMTEAERDALKVYIRFAKRAPKKLLNLIEKTFSLKPP